MNRYKYCLWADRIKCKTVTTKRIIELKFMPFLVKGNNHEEVRHSERWCNNKTVLCHFTIIGRQYLREFTRERNISFD